MNLKNFLLGLFRGFSAEGELEQVRNAARQDAQLVVGAYVDEFEAEASRLLADRQQRFAGLLTDETVQDAEFTVQKKATSAKGRKR